MDFYPKLPLTLAHSRRPNEFMPKKKNAFKKAFHGVYSQDGRDVRICGFVTTNKQTSSNLQTTTLDYHILYATHFQDRPTN